MRSSKVHEIYVATNLDAMNYAETIRISRVKAIIYSSG